MPLRSVVVTWHYCSQGSLIYHAKSLAEDSSCGRGFNWPSGRILSISEALQKIDSFCFFFFFFFSPVLPNAFRLFLLANMIVSEQWYLLVSRFQNEHQHTRLPSLTVGFGGFPSTCSLLSRSGSWPQITLTQRFPREPPAFTMQSYLLRLTK